MAQEPSAQILVVEDDEEMRSILGMILEGAGFCVELASSSALALKKIAEKNYDLILIERVLPEIPGIELIRRIRQFKNLPILFLTAHADPDEIVQALDAGADDYLQKPFERNCIISRARSLLKRFNATDLADIERVGKMSLGQLTIDIKSFDVFADAERVQLTPSEFKLLHALVQNRGKVLTREKLMECVQGEGIAVIDRAIDTHVFGLRKKLGTCSELIETVRGVGYRITG